MIDADSRIGVVVSTPIGLVAGGNGPDGEPKAWISADGREWTEGELPTTGMESTPYATVPVRAAASDGVVVLFDAPFGNVSALAVTEALAEHMGSDEGLTYGWSWDVSAQLEARFVVDGPLGLTAVEISAADLGLSDAEVRSLVEPETENRMTTAWASADGRTWSTSRFENWWPESVAVIGDQLVAAGYGENEMEILVSADGTTWQPAGGPTFDVFPMASWGDGMIRVRQVDTLTVEYSTDLESWESLGVESLFPPVLNWHVFPIVSGDAGVAAIVNGFADPPFRLEEPQPLVLERNGYTLTLTGSRIELSDGELDLAWPRHREQVAENVEIDFRERVMTFLHPDRGDPLVAFTFDELDQAVAEWEAGGYQFGPQHRALLFSPDGEEWSLSDLSPVLGDDGWMSEMLVTDSHLIAVLARPPYEGGFEVWVGRPHS